MKDEFRRSVPEETQRRRGRKNRGGKHLVTAIRKTIVNLVAPQHIRCAFDQLDDAASVADSRIDAQNEVNYISES
ncbi:MAG: hypothetical protein LQ345_002545 [Seirophora villosa]|nr:MAG: hypothetical protein LQ345_002545 [Seirophora villosa]